MEYWWLFSELISVTNWVLQFVVSMYERRKLIFMYDVSWRCKRKPERENEYIRYISIVLIVNHIWVHSHIKRWKFFKNIFENSAGKFSTFLAWKFLLQHQYNLSWECWYFQWWFSRWKFSRTGKCCHEKKPCAFPFHNISTLLWRKFHHAHMFSTWWISSGFVKIFN
jgi:hypothetical protein